MSTTNDFLNLINSYQKNNPERINDTEKIINLFEKQGDKAFHRDCFDDGHFTGSVLVVNKEKTKVLLMHHIKLGMWLQFGGHADGEIDIKNVALSELEEESGIKENDIVILNDIYDIDIHEIPARKLEPAHFHYDISFLAIAREDIKIIREEKEAKKIKWCDINEILENKNFNTSTSIHRMLENL